MALIGLRQAGKTTLALEVAEGTDAALFLKGYEDRLVILDEIHRAPELFQTLRGRSLSSHTVRTVILPL